MKEFKINNEKVITSKPTNDVRIIVGNEKMWFESLKAAIEQYLIAYNALSNKSLFDINGQLNVNILLCGYPINVDFAFELYDEIRSEYKLDIPKYTALRYGKKTILFSPSQI